MTITLNLAPELERQLRSAAAQVGVAPDTFILQAIRERLSANYSSNTKDQRLPDKEAQLLMQINQSLAHIPWQQYHTLVAKRQQEVLTAEEHQQLLVITDQIEVANAKRLGLLIELSRLRNLTLDLLMQHLGLRPGLHA